MRRPLRQLVVLAATAVLVTACGDSDGDRAADDQAKADAAASESAASASAASESAAAAELEAQQATYGACQEAVERFMTELQEIGSRLNIGMNYDEYSDYLSDARVTYDRDFTATVIDDMEPECLSSVAVPLENAFQAYVNVLTLWGDCIEDYDCDFNEGETDRKAQRGWVRAEKQTQKAVNALAAMKPGA